MQGHQTGGEEAGEHQAPDRRRPRQIEREPGQDQQHRSGVDQEGVARKMGRHRQPHRGEISVDQPRDPEDESPQAIDVAANGHDTISPFRATVLQHSLRKQGVQFPSFARGENPPAGWWKVTSVAVVCQNDRQPHFRRVEDDAGSLIGRIKRPTIGAFSPPLQVTRNPRPSAAAFCSLAVARTGSPRRHWWWLYIRRLGAGV